MQTKEKAQHTPGKVFVGKGANPLDQIFDSNGAIVADLKWTNHTPETRAVNALRLVAAWNACEGIPTEALEGGVVGELLKALEAAYTALYHHGLGDSPDPIAIAKAKPE